MGGMFIKRGGYITDSRIFTESLYTERGVEWIVQAHVKEVMSGETVYENLKGEEKSVKHDFAMLLPPFSGVGLKAYNKKDEDITSELFAPNGFMIVDGDYTKNHTSNGVLQIGRKLTNIQSTKIFLLQELLLHHRIQYQNL